MYRSPIMPQVIISTRQILLRIVVCLDWKKMRRKYRLFHNTVPFFLAPSLSHTSVAIRQKVHPSRQVQGLPNALARSFFLADWAFVFAFPQHEACLVFTVCIYLPTLSLWRVGYCIVFLPYVVFDVLSAVLGCTYDKWARFVCPF